MDPTNSPSQKKPNQILGPRPTALKLNPDSHKIKKPPLPPRHHPRPHAQQPQQPMIIYDISPKIIHTEVSDFMSVVQRLTGLSSSDFSSSTSNGDLSPAARLAATERACPRDHTHRFISKITSDNIITGTATGRYSDDVLAMVEELDIGQAPGILSPGPGMLPPVPPGFFSPASDPNALSFLNDFVMSPSLPGGGGYGGGFMGSPSSGFFLASIASPMASPDFFNLFMDFEGKEN